MSRSDGVPITKKTAHDWLATMQPFRMDDGQLSLAEQGGIYVGSDVLATLELAIREAFYEGQRSCGHLPDWTESL